MSRFIAISGLKSLSFGLAMCLGACAFSTEVSERDLALKEMSVDAEVVAKGREMYQAFCMACHGAEDVSIDSVSNLFDQKWYRGGTPKEIESSIRNGYLDTGMPPWGEMIPAEDLESIVAYLLSFQAK